MPLRVCIEAAHNPAAAGSLVQIQPPQPNFLAARGPLRKVQRRSIERIAIQSSSVVERSAVNRLVVGSNPTSGAISMFWVYFLRMRKASSTSVTPIIWKIGFQVIIEPTKHSANSREKMVHGGWFGQRSMLIVQSLCVASAKLNPGNQRA